MILRQKHVKDQKSCLFKVGNAELWSRWRSFVLELLNLDTDEGKGVIDLDQMYIKTVETRMGLPLFFLESGMIVAANEF